jgi:hypothetical protein
MPASTARASTRFYPHLSNHPRNHMVAADIANASFAKASFEGR